MSQVVINDRDTVFVISSANLVSDTYLTLYREYKNTGYLIYGVIKIITRNKKQETQQ